MIDNEQKLQRLIRLANKIEELAYDGQNGSTAYAFDRLTQIRKTIEVVMIQIKQWPKTP